MVQTYPAGLKLAGVGTASNCNKGLTVCYKTYPRHWVNSQPASLDYFPGYYSCSASNMCAGLDMSAAAALLPLLQGEVSCWAELNLHVFFLFMPYVSSGVRSESAYCCAVASVVLITTTELERGPPYECVVQDTI